MTQPPLPHLAPSEKAPIRVIVRYLLYLLYISLCCITIYNLVTSRFFRTWWFVISLPVVVIVALTIAILYQQNRKNNKGELDG